MILRRRLPVVSVNHKKERLPARTRSVHTHIPPRAGAYLALIKSEHLNFRITRTQTDRQVYIGTSFLATVLQVSCSTRLGGILSLPHSTTTASLTSSFSSFPVYQPYYSTYTHAMMRERSRRCCWLPASDTIYKSERARARASGVPRERGSTHVYTFTHAHSVVESPRSSLFLAAASSSCSVRRTRRERARERARGKKVYTLALARRGQHPCLLAYISRGPCRYTRLWRTHDGLCLCTYTEKRVDGGNRSARDHDDARLSNILHRTGIATDGDR